MTNTTNRDGRITNRNTLRHVRTMLIEMVNQVGYKATARAIHWNPGPVHAVTQDPPDWTQRVLYPEDVAKIELVHDVVMHYEEMNDEARRVTDSLIELSHQFVDKVRDVRRVLRHMRP